MNDPYTILGVSPSASDEEISKAYKKLARQYHPDLNPGNKAAEMKMKEINGAYEAVKDIRSGKRAYSGTNTAYSGASGSYGSYGGYRGYADPFETYRDSYGTRFYGFDFGDFFRQNESRGSNTSSGSPFGVSGFFRSLIRFSVIMTLIRFVLSFFLYPRL